MNKKSQEIIKILQEIKNSNILNIEVNTSIENTIKKVNDIYDENTVKVSILGEFSSGKSTFINGILKEDILSYGDEPTTAINTVIKYGAKPLINAIFENGQKKRINKKDIKLYIKEGEIKNKCSTLEIINNNSYLKDGLVIIDTPGANINKLQHNIQRKKAVKESSVGIFLISCQSLTSNSFIEFLKENKSDLQKIMFVLTKVDIYEEDDISIDMDNKTPKQKLNSAKEYITNVIREHGGIKRPSVYSVSAKSFMDKKKLKIIDVEKSFEEVIKEIKVAAIRDKERIIQEEIEKNLNQITKELDYLLGRTDVDCSREIEKVNGKIEEFDKFINGVINKFELSLNNDKISKKNKIREKVNSYKSSCYIAVKKRIDEIGTLSSFKDKANRIVNEEYSSFMQRCTSLRQEELNDFGKAQFKLVEEELIQYFNYIEKTYEHLGIQRRIRRRRAMIAIIISIVVYIIITILLSGEKAVPFFAAAVTYIIAYMVQGKSVKFSIPASGYLVGESNINSNATFTSSTGIDDSHVTGGGLLIGAFLGGPLGAIVGAGIGAVVGNLFFGDKLRKAKEGLLEAVEGDLVNQTNKFADRTNFQFDKVKSQLLMNLNEYINANKELYGKLLKGIEEYNQGIFVRLTDKQKSAKKFSKELNKHIAN